MLPIHRILVPTDFTENSFGAFPIAAALARDHGAKLLALHVREAPIAPFVPFGAVPPPRTDARRFILDRLEHLRVLDQTIVLEYVLVEGAPAEEIVKAAVDRHCDLIVLGAHGRTALSHLLMGSVAIDVSRKAPCPVLTVKQGRTTADKSMVSKGQPAPSGTGD